MGQRYLIDSNIIIDYTSGLLPQHASDFVEDVFNRAFVISVVVKVEVLGYDDPFEKQLYMEEFIRAALIIPLNDAVVQQAIVLKRKYKKLKLGDAIIAASALINDLTVVTRNVADFKGVENLHFINPWDRDQIPSS